VSYYLLASLIPEEVEHDFIISKSGMEKSYDSKTALGDNSTFCCRIEILPTDYSRKMQNWQGKTQYF
jgi:hypothetical protein